MSGITVRQEGEGLRRGLKILLPFAACLILANLYYAQPILADITDGIGMRPASSGIIITMSQLGYVMGVLFLVPLGDVLENRILIACMAIGAGVALLMVALSTGVVLFLAASFFVGMLSVAMQAMVPFAIGMASANERGKILGMITAGGLLGVILSRPAASLMTSVLGWRSIYFSASGLMLVLGVALLRVLPRKAPSAKGISYPDILGSMLKLLRDVPQLRLRLSVSATVFIGYSMFWATAPIVLRGTHEFSHTQMALFSLAGLITPPCVLAMGRLIDQGYGRIMIFSATVLIASAYLLTTVFSLYAMVFVLAVLMIDPSMNLGTLPIQQKNITLVPEARSRLNAITVAAAFTGGAAGSAMGPWLFSHFGWEVVAGVGASLMVIPFAVNVVLTGFERPARLGQANQA